MTRLFARLVKPRRPRLLLATLLVPLVVSAATIVLMSTTAGASLEQRTVDARFAERGTLSAPDDIVVVAIDRTHDARHGAWPIDRYTWALAITALDQAEVAGIAIDVPFEGAGIAEGTELAAGEDESLATAIAEARTPIVIATAQTDDDRVPERRDAIDGLRPSDDLDAARTAVIGGISVRMPASDGSVRSYPSSLGQQPSLAVALAEAAGSTDAGDDAPRQLLLNWYGPRGTFEHLSFTDVATGQAAELADLSGKLVLVGPTEGVGRDDHDVPVGGPMSSVEIQATALANLLDGTWLREPDGWVEPVAVIAIALAIWAMLLVLPLGLSVPGSVALVAGWGWLAVQLFERGLVVPMLAPMLAGGVAFGSVSLLLAALSVRERVRVKGLFARYVHADVVRELIDGEDAISLAGEEREITVLFSDIRGFTTMSEHVDPAELVAQLNEYFEAMVEVVAAHHGAVDKFLGDGMMAIFGAPARRDDHAERACCAALDMLDRLEHVNDGRAQRGLAPLRIGIGIHTGRAVVGNVGSPPFRVDFTAIGDTVNLAARIEAMTKELGALVVASDATREAVAAAGVELDFDELGSVVARGRSEATLVHAVHRPGRGRTGDLHGERAA